jgi:hypothetical protein
MPNNVNNRSQTYAIARALQRCGSCARRTPVVGLVLPPGHETLEIGADAEEEAAAADVWEAAEAGALLFFIEYLPEAVRNRLQQLSQHYCLDHGEPAGQSYWMNHCSFCGMRQGDFELYCEPEGAFLPISEQAAASIRLHEVPEPFEAQAAGYAYAPQFFDNVQR